MTEQETHVVAACVRCGKAYRVPDADRVYACKACRGPLRVREAPARPAPPASLIPCDGCQALNVADARFCIECGALLHHPEHTPGKPWDRDAARLRVQASRALKRAYKGIAGVVWMYRFGALVYGLATVFAVLALARTEVPLGPGVLVVGLTTALSALMLMGAIHVPFNPFSWTVAIALLATVVSVVHFVGPDPFGLAALGSALWAAAAWAALVPTFRFRRLIAEHLDLYVLHHASKSTRLSVHGRFPKERHERLVAAMRRAARRAWKISAAAAAIFCLGSALGTWGVVTRLRAPELSSVQRSFEQAWNQRGLEDLAPFFHAGVRVPELARLAGLAEGNGWTGGLPPLADGKRRDEDGRVLIDYDLAGVPMTAAWALFDHRWGLAHVELPPPPFEPALERFLAAWRASDPKALATCFSAGKRTEMLKSIETAARNRGWERYPEVQATRVTDSGDDQRSVTLDLAEGRIETDWGLRGDGRWGLRGLRFHY